MKSKVAATLSGLDLGSYTSSYSSKRTVERALQIISEAVKALPSELLATLSGDRLASDFKSRQSSPA